MVMHRLHGIRRKRDARRGLFVQQGAGQHLDRARPASKRQGRNSCHGKPIEEIGAKPPLRHCRFQIRASAGQHAALRLAAGGFTQGPVLAVFQHAQQGGLRSGRELGHFIQIQGAARGFGKQACPRCAGAAEGALRMSEQQALDQVGCQRGAIDRDEGAG
ncbi:hypothetical protein D3C72_1015970 [compost metagenome]